MSINITLKELILEFQPFSPELVAWCKKHPDFFNALKNLHPDKFISPSMIMLSYPPTGDEVIGVYSYHNQLKHPIFKQDFIVNIGFKNETFMLYTRNPLGSSANVKDINDFYTKYNQYGYKKEQHHLTINELPEELKDRAQDTIALAEKVKDIDITKIPQSRINSLYNEVKELKESEYWINKYKLDQ